MEIKHYIKFLNLCIHVGFNKFNKSKASTCSTNIAPSSILKAGE